MKKLILLKAIASLNVAVVAGQCTTLFSFSAYFENVTFINQSNIPNAHYFWNFGDGTGSNFKDPIHKFPETGSYLVTLFARDTVSNCASYYEYWVNLTKFSPDSCQPVIDDSIFSFNSQYYLSIIDNSSYCDGYYKNIDSGPAQNLPPGISILLTPAWGHARFLSRLQFTTYDTINSYLVYREAYKTSLFNYSSSKNYNDCSANFEFSVISQDSTGQTILFSAMNKTASHYQWEIFGFGNPIVSNNDTISHFYPYHSNNLWMVGLKTEGSSGCIDTLYQNILVQENVETTVNINELNNVIRYNIYPNPFRDKAILEFAGAHQNVTFKLYNIKGQILRTINNITSGQIIIDREDLSSGLYYFTLEAENNIISKGKLLTH